MNLWSLGIHDMYLPSKKQGLQTEMYESIQIPNQFQFISAFFVSFELNPLQKKLRRIEFELNLVCVELWSLSELNLNRIVKDPGQSK